LGKKQDKKMNRIKTTAFNIGRFCPKLQAHARAFLATGIFFAKDLSRVPNGSIVFFPLQQNFLGCGLAGIVAFKKKRKTADTVDTAALDAMAETIQTHRFQNCKENGYDLDTYYLGGRKLINDFLKSAHTLKSKEQFFTIFTHQNIQQELIKITGRLNRIITSEAQLLSAKMGHIATRDVEVLSTRIEDLRDIAWCLSSEIGDNVENVKHLMAANGEPPNHQALNIFKNINAVLNSIDRLEVRGRDSAAWKSGDATRRVFHCFLFWIRRNTKNLGQPWPVRTCSTGWRSGRNKMCWLTIASVFTKAQITLTKPWLPSPLYTRSQRK
jgi:glucosamine--fructose-6-phosphate aminotransferase (isomerizing)